MIHIESDIFMDEDVQILIGLPFVPRIGEFIELDYNTRTTLENMAKSDLENIRNYAPTYFYGDSYKCLEPTQENLKDFSFVDAKIVKNVLYYPEDEIIHIEIH